MSVVEWASAYASAGWPIVRIPPMAKGPRGDEWQLQQFTPRDFAPGDNIGIKVGDQTPGSVELVDIDCDCPEAIALAPSFLPRTATFGRRGDGKTPGLATSYQAAGPRRHWLYTCVGLRTRKPAHCHVELRARSSKGTPVQTMAPGSIHPDTGEWIEWVDALAPTPIDPVELERAFVKLAVAIVVAREWARPELAHQRHDAALALAGTLWYAGWTEAEASAVCLPAMGLSDGDESDRAAAIRSTWEAPDDAPRWGMPSLTKLFSAEGIKALDRHIADLALGVHERGRGGVAVEVRAAANGVEDPSSMPACNDAGNAELLARMYALDLRNVDGIGWLRWDPGATRWIVDKRGPYGEAIDLGKRLIAYGQSLGADLGKPWVQWGIQSGMGSRIEHAIKLFAKRPEVSRDVDQLDRDTWLLGTPSGVVDLRTGALRSADREDLITRQCGVAFDPDAPMPSRFATFVREVMCGRDELAAYLLRFLGHTLTGDVREHVLSIWHGAQGGNGKGTLLNVMQSIMGDYAGTAAPALLMQSSSSSHPTGLWDLRGKRLVLTNETPEGGRWNESLVKQLTGGDVVKARGMRQDFVQFTPTWKLVVATNTRPLVRESGGSFWRRVHLLPWHASFTGREDRNLQAALESEGTSILRWLVYACGEWARAGLQPPTEVRAASDDYRESQDTIGAFVKDALVQEAEGWVDRAALFSAYRRWAETGGEHALGRQAFARVLQDRGWQLAVRNGSRGFRGWKLSQGSW